MKIVFFGTSSFSAEILRFLKEQPGLEVVAIVTRPDRPQGRDLHLKGCPVKELALTQYPYIPLLQPEKASTVEVEEQLRSFKADLFLVVAYGEILKKPILSIPLKACVNIHTSLLPKYRGAAPMQRCLMQGESVSGVTLMEMVLAMDAGDILLQEQVPIGPDTNAEQLEAALLEAAKKGLTQLFSDFDGYYANKQPQNEHLVSLAPKILPQEGHIHPSRSAWEIHNQIRALAPFPGAYINVRWGEGPSKRLKVLKSKPLPNESIDAPPGRLLIDRSCLRMVCQEGCIEFLVVQLEGKKPMPTADFLRGVSQYFSIDQ